MPDARVMPDKREAFTLEDLQFSAPKDEYVDTSLIAE